MTTLAPTALIKCPCTLADKPPDSQYRYIIHMHHNAEPHHRITVSSFSRKIGTKTGFWLLKCAAACGDADGEGAILGGGVVGEVGDEGGWVAEALDVGSISLCEARMNSSRFATVFGIVNLFKFIALISTALRASID
ncbi:hypothetical protein BDR22DRAFT_825670 [Usnea florida]